MSRRIRILIFSVLGLLVLWPFFSKGQRVQNKAYEILLDTLLKHDVPELEVQKVLQSRAILLDARELEEYELSHLQDAVWVGYNDFDLDRLQGIENHDSIIVYCSIGYRSEVIANRLKEAGYSNVFNFYGGIFEWSNQGHDVVDEDGQKTEQVHAFDRKWGVWLNKKSRTLPKKN
jgi:rhodanese-related sulfurtransferase